MILPHGKELIGFLPLSDLYDEFSEHERLQVFAKKGCVCVTCGREGKLLALGREMSGYKQYRKRGTVGAVHIDLYTNDFVLMTVDHIVPKYVCKQLGWTKEQMESLDNKQPMCDPCNGAKGHKIFTQEEALSFQRQMMNNTPKQYKDNKILVNLVPNIHALLGDTV
jgi:5-methylcytosine-specific restriction endonuclease McrA